MRNDKTSDPFPGLGHRRLYAPLGVDSAGDHMKRDPPIPREEVRNTNMNDDGAIKTEAADALRVALDRTEAVVRKAMRGRPAKVGEPWKAEGISRAEWYRRKGNLGDTKDLRRSEIAEKAEP